VSTHNKLSDHQSIYVWSVLQTNIESGL